MVELRLPNIKGNDKEQLVQIRSYLYQLTEQLQFALNNIETTGGSGGSHVVNQARAYSASSGMANGDAEATFAAIKALIIKSADIVEAYYDEISTKLEGLYVAKSDFGTFAEATNQTITQNSVAVEQKFTNIQQILTDNSVEIEQKFTNIQQTVTNNSAEVEQKFTNIQQALTDNSAEVEQSFKDIQQTLTDNSAEVEQNFNNIQQALTNNSADIEQSSKDIQQILKDMANLNLAIVEVNAHINSGILYYDKGIPVYGIEIGQKTELNGVEVFNKFARFTSDRLSFYDQNGEEVAYLSDYKLYITSADVSRTLKLGAYEIDTTQGFRVKYIGRG